MPRKNAESKLETHENAAIAPDLSFEQAASELEEIVNKLNTGSVKLDEMIALFERGTALSKHCNELLAQYDGRIAKALRNSSGAEE